MKKLLAAVLTAIMLFAQVAVAEGIDLSSYSTEELIELKLSIDEELHLRDEITDNYLYQGKYRVGEDFDAGRYVFKCVKVLNEKHDYGDIVAFKSEGGYRARPTRLKIDQEYSIRLEDGDSVELLLIECTISKID